LLVVGNYWFVRVGAKYWIVISVLAYWFGC